MWFVRLFLFSILVFGPYGGRAEARTLYEIRQRDGSVTFTYRSPKSGENYRVVRRKTPARSSFIRSKGWVSMPRTSRYDSLIHNCAGRAGLDPLLVKAVVHAESAFDERATSRKGAMGLMQLMPATARHLGVKDPYEPRANICGGSRYLKSLLEKFSGNQSLALAAYNAGPKAVERYASIPPYRETINYVRKVRRLHRRYRAKSGIDG